MPTLTLTLPRPHPSQQTIIRESRRFNVVVCGRRFGKTTLGIDRLTGPALEGYPVAWFSPTYKMLAEVWRESVRILRPVISRPNVQERRLELVTGGVVEMWSLDQPDAARGRKYKRVVVDEAAMVRALQDAWQAVIRPTLTDFEGDGYFLSTPKGLNFFHQMYAWGQDELRPEWMSWQMPTLSNPHIKASEVEAARRELPERIFAQEYLARFLEGIGSVFRRVQDAATATQQDAPTPGHRYILGVDWGKLNDFTVLTVLDLDGRCQVWLDRFNQIDYQLQLARLRAVYERFQPVTIIAERNSMGEPIIEQIHREGMRVQPFTTTNATKAQAIDALALAFERGDLRILDDPVLIGELQAYESERLPSGLLRYGAPEGLHDDTVMALALAWHGATDYRPHGGIFF